MPIPTRLVLLVWTAVLTACSSIVVQTDVSYDARYSATVLDVYMPPPSDAPRPAVLIVHGGGWHDGIFRSSMEDHARRLAEAGYVTVNIEYRLVPGGGEFPHAVQDCFCALAWLRGHASELNVAPDRIAGLGYSAGGHLVSMLGTAASAEVVAPDCEAGPAAPLNAVVSGAGPQDMTKLAQADAVIQFMGGTSAAMPERYLDASPLSYVAPGAPPFLFIHGNADYFVNIDDHSRRMQDALRAVGASAKLVEIPGGGHIWNNAAGDWELPLTSLDTPEAQIALVDFLDHAIGPVP